MALSVKMSGLGIPNPVTNASKMHADSKAATAELTSSFSGETPFDAKNYYHRGQQLRREAQSSKVFIKDFPMYIDHMWDEAFLSHFRHSFLIRDPAKTITSMHKHWPDFHPKEVGLKDQRKLFDTLCELQGEPPPVIDSDDLLEDPQTMVRLYCEAVGIPFIAEALSWEPGARDEVSWWDGGSFHANLRNSNGLKPQVRTYIDIAESPRRVQDIYEDVLEDYNYLHAFRVRAS